MGRKVLRPFPGVSLLFLLYSVTLPGLAQNKLPTIQAIGTVTLKNGATHEGVIALGYSYDNKGFHANAFYVETTTDKKLINLDLDFSGFYTGLLEKNGAVELFYAESKSEQSQSRYNTTTDGSGNKVLNNKSLSEENFILRKTFGLYPELPLSLNVSAKVTGNDVLKNFNVDEIVSVELIKDLPDHWEKKIQQARTRLTKKMEADKKRSNLWLDYREPIWYHEIIHDNTELSKWRLYFN